MVRIIPAAASQIRSTAPDDIEQEAGAEAAGDKGSRAPQPHRAIGAIVAAEPAYSVSIGERHQGVESAAASA